MPASQTEVCNLALIRVGADRISSIDQDTKSARLLNAIYDQKRRSVLRAHRWNFATKRVSLTPSATTPEWGYTYEFILPNDSVRFLDTDPEDIDHVLESDAAGNDRVIRTDEPTLDVLYIFDQTDEAQWDDLFADAFAWCLAEEIAYALTQSLALQDRCGKRYKESIVEARSHDGAEGKMRDIQIDTWTGSRR